jgi:DoxX
MMNGINDELILAARLLLATLFLIFGWRKLTDFPGTVNQMAQFGVPTPLPGAAREWKGQLHARHGCAEIVSSSAYENKTEGCHVSDSRWTISVAKRDLFLAATAA